jgi:hypothetical protein
MIIYILAAIGAHTVAKWVIGIVRALIGDRTGNSGRYKHWEDGE